MTNTWAIIPVKPLRFSKSRLSNVLTADERAELTRTMLSRVLDVLNESVGIDRVLVVSRDQEVLKLARQHGATSYDENDKQGLNAAVTRAAHVCAARRVESILILPADLPFITREDVETVLAFNNARTTSDRDDDKPNGFVVICGDQESEGTNALLLSPPNGFTFHYGPGSFGLHLQEAAEQELVIYNVEAPGIQFDLDTEEDWRNYKAIEAESESLMPSAGK